MNKIDEKSIIEAKLDQDYNLENVNHKDLIPHQASESIPKDLSISSMNNHIVKLIEEIDEGEVEIDDFRKSLLVFELTKLRYGLRLVNRINRMLDFTFEVEDKLFDKNTIENMSVRELLVMNNLSNKTLNNYMFKINDIMNGLNTNLLESLVASTSNIQTKKTSAEDSDKKNNITTLALDLITTYTSKMEDQSAQDNDFDDDEDDELDKFDEDIIDDEESFKNKLNSHDERFSLDDAKYVESSDSYDDDNPESEVMYSTNPKDKNYSELEDADRFVDKLDKVDEVTF